MYYQTLLDKFTHAVKEITGEKLTGIYLHGSLAMGCFHPEKSDIDLIVVGGKDFDLTDVLCIAEELHCALGKPVDVYELREINPQSAFYDTILAEGVQIA